MITDKAIAAMNNAYYAEAVASQSPRAQWEAAIQALLDSGIRDDLQAIIDSEALTGNTIATERAKAIMERLS